jgi:hypothetical protein
MSPWLWSGPDQLSRGALLNPFSFSVNCELVRQAIARYMARGTQYIPYLNWIMRLAPLVNNRVWDFRQTFYQVGYNSGV